MKKFFISFLFLITLNANAMEKETTFNEKLFNKAQSEGKIIIISSWIKYCSSCAGQMKILNKAKKDGKLNDIEFENIEYFFKLDNAISSIFEFIFNKSCSLLIFVRTKVNITFP